MKTILLALAALTLAAPSFAQEGNGEPFPYRTPGTTAYVGQQVADVGSAAYPDVTGRPGTQLTVASADLAPQTGSEAVVQTASSLPVGAEQGAVAYAQLTPAWPSLASTRTGRLASSTRTQR